LSARDAVSLRFVGMLVDLPGMNLSLKMIELFDGQGVEQLNAALDLKGRLQKMLVLLLVQCPRTPWDRRRFSGRRPERPEKSGCAHGHRRRE